MVNNSPHEEWIRKAGHDLKASQILIANDDPDPVYDAAIYHTQQCAEKALKAFLVFSEIPIDKTHNLRRLIELCHEIDTEFAPLFDDAEMLTPYATAFRYQGSNFDPDLVDVQEAIEAAFHIFQFVQTKLIKN